MMNKDIPIGTIIQINATILAGVLILITILETSTLREDQIQNLSNRALPTLIIPFSFAIIFTIYSLNDLAKKTTVIGLVYLMLYSIMLSVGLEQN